MTLVGLRRCSDNLDATVHDCGSVTICPSPFAGTPYASYARKLWMGVKEAAYS